jgi:hypothetical protein
LPLADSSGRHPWTAPVFILHRVEQPVQRLADLCDRDGGTGAIIDRVVTVGTALDLPLDRFEEQLDVAALEPDARRLEV